MKNKKNAKVGIMTLYNCYNYGAVLQAYATYRYLEIIGYKNVEIIDYENKFESKSKKTISFIFQGSIKEIVKKIIQFVVFGKNRNLKKSFKEFCSSLKKSTRKYNSLSELKETEYDILISGSDQIWNPVIFSELDKAFLLDFSDKARKISISSSAGSYRFKDREKDELINCLKKYKAISVREDSLKEQIQGEIKNVFVSVDPTLVLTSEEWKQNLPANNKYDEKNNDYVLVYIVDANLNSYLPEIRELKKRMNKEFWLITPYKFKMECIDRNIVGAKPNDFISLIENADYIITNSFHGIIFSSNFRKKFITLENHKNPIRAKNYLESIGADKLIIKNAQEARKINIEEINDSYYEKLRKNADSTKKWIGEQIG